MRTEYEKDEVGIENQSDKKYRFLVLLFHINLIYAKREAAEGHAVCTLGFPRLPHIWERR